MVPAPDARSKVTLVPLAKVRSRPVRVPAGFVMFATGPACTHVDTHTRTHARTHARRRQEIRVATSALAERDLATDGGARIVATLLCWRRVQRVATRHVLDGGTATKWWHGNQGY